ncbi:MAG: carboxymuconolactone decarboxylase family protein [Anaerolineae bacterium]|nr:carboxymuconolactone decarboxylase family protein [Anaerolineae bacterium]
MQPRINAYKADPGAYQALKVMGDYVDNSGLERSLLDLVLIRASQINHCAFCLDMHTKDARVSGETEQRLYSLDAWRETPFFSDRERAALEWTEAVTLVSESCVPDAIYEQVRQQFTETEIIKLTMAVIVINSYNRLNVSLRAVPGHYKSQRQPQAAIAAR